MRSARALAILDQRYKVARELRALAALISGRDSAQFRKADAKCQTSYSKYMKEWKLQNGEQS